jgi:hypothetical protein
MQVRRQSSPIIFALSDGHGEIVQSQCFALAAEAIRSSAWDDVSSGFKKGETAPCGPESRGGNYKFSLDFMWSLISLLTGLASLTEEVTGQAHRGPAG